MCKAYNHNNIWLICETLRINTPFLSLLMYGISHEQVNQVYSELQRVHGAVIGEKDMRRLKSSLCMCALNCTWEQLHDLQGLWTSPNDPPVSIRALREDFSRTAKLLSSPHLMNPNLRFQHGVPWLSDVTCIVDVTTIPCRARKKHTVWDSTRGEYVQKDATYSGKHHEHCFKVEFWMTLAGVPFFFRGPVNGTIHDAKGLSGRVIRFPELE